MNKTILIIVVILVAIVGGYFLLKRGYQAPAPAPVTPEVTAPERALEEAPVAEIKEITIIGNEFSFSPSAITAQAGQRVKINFQNGGSIIHNLIIEGLMVSTRTIGSGTTDTIEFTAPASGTYTFFCSVPGHRSAGMEGSLEVK